MIELMTPTGRKWSRAARADREDETGPLAQDLARGGHLGAVEVIKRTGATTARAKHLFLQVPPHIPAPRAPPPPRTGPGAMV